MRRLGAVLNVYAVGRKVGTKQAADGNEVPWYTGSYVFLPVNNMLPVNEAGSTSCYFEGIF